MIKRSKSLFFGGVICFLCLLSCDIKPMRDADYKVGFEATNERIIFPLDSLTKRDNQVVYFSDELVSIAIYNDLNHSIYIYHLEDENQPPEIIPLFREGPNSLLAVKAIYMNRYDSIYVYSELDGSLNIVDPSGAKIYSETINPIFDRRVATVSQPKLERLGEEFLFPIRPTGLSGDSSKYNVLAFNLKSKTIRLLLEDSKKMSGGIWGGMLRQNHIAYNKSSNTAVVGYPWSEELMLYDLATDKIIKSKYASSSHAIAPVQFTSQQQKKGTRQYLLSQCWLSSLVYDRYRNTYYRSVQLGRDLESGDGRSQSYKSISSDNVFVRTLVLDEDLNVIGDTGSLGFGSALLVLPDGVYFFDSEFEEENEDVLVFRKYVLKELIKE